ncbi:20192_t:CDS:2 [Racocetra fulgida]|uniref:20192_t:CDS:1 n=1 Tax=Racocetra fulgida TaxID=60492 RepID=A0A9N8W5A2_9GLOM|nr:20192_t:CDS:2 [Racocetra fulgida]
MYDEFGKIHVTVTQHAGQKETWNQISSKWGYCRQDLVEKFVTQCKNIQESITDLNDLINNTDTDTISLEGNSLSRSATLNQDLDPDNENQETVNYNNTDPDNESQETVSFSVVSLSSFIGFF